MPLWEAEPPGRSEKASAGCLLRVADIRRWAMSSRTLRPLSARSGHSFVAFERLDRCSVEHLLRELFCLQWKKGAEFLHRGTKTNLTVPKRCAAWPSERIRAGGSLADSEV